MEKVKLSLQKLRDRFIADGADPIETDIFLAQAQERLEIWKYFEKYALQVWGTGRRRYGAQTICHQIRWHVEIECNNEEFIINNNWIAYYARMFMYCYPEAVGFFEIRTFKEKNNGNDTRIDREVQYRGANSIPPNIQPGDEAWASTNHKVGEQELLFPTGNR